jgi:hypothetical protein
MKYALISVLTMGMVTVVSSPSYAQFSQFSSGSDNCANFCVKFDLGSSNSGDSFNSFNNSTGSNPNNLRWQVGVTWRPNPPEVLQAEAEKVKQRLDDNKSLTIALAEAIAQNKTELARGLAILLAPRLGYSDPRKLIAEMREGATNNIGSTPPTVQPIVPITIPSTKPNSIDPSSPTIELR